MLAAQQDLAFCFVYVKCWGTNATTEGRPPIRKSLPLTPLDARGEHLVLCHRLRVHLIKPPLARFVADLLGMLGFGEHGRDALAARGRFGALAIGLRRCERDAVELLVRVRVRG